MTIELNASTVDVLELALIEYYTLTLDKGDPHEIRKVLRAVNEIITRTQ